MESDPVAAALLAVAAELGRLAQALAAQAPAGAPASPAPSPELPQLVTLDQMAAMVGLRKTSMRRYRASMPAPAIEGGHGSRSRWAWEAVRPWLEETFGVRLPENFPG